MKAIDESDIVTMETIESKAVVGRSFINLLPFIGLVLGLVMWCVDAAIDSFIIHPDEGFWESFFSEEFTEIWMRSLVVIVMISSAVVVQYFMRKQHQFELLLLNDKQKLEEMVAERTEELQQQANIDPLTQIYNRRKFSIQLEIEIERAKRYKQPLSIILLDVDFFKGINDRYGHAEGDRILKVIAKQLRVRVRKSDCYARWGGEEFILSLPHTDLITGRKVAENLRLLMATITYGEDTQSITASLGVSQLNENDSAISLIKRADEALYKAKHAGRNQVCISD